MKHVQTPPVSMAQKLDYKLMKAPGHKGFFDLLKTGKHPFSLHELQTH
jgi:hypothetical protein